MIHSGTDNIAKGVGAPLVKYRSGLKSENYISDNVDIENINPKINAIEINNPSQSYSKTEEFDPNMLLHLIRLKTIDNEDLKKLRAMYKNRAQGNKLHIHYGLGKDAKRMAYGKTYPGRLFPIEKYGLQTLNGDIRAALSKDFYWDLDIVNAQGNILNQLASLNGWTNTYLNQYCSERDAIFTQMQTEGFDRPQCKLLFLRLLFGGLVNKNDPQWVRDKFAPEVAKIMENLCNQQPLLLKACKKKTPMNPLGSCCALILQSEERQCLLTLDNFLTQKGRSMDTYIHDGGLIRKLENESELPPDLIREAEDYIHSQLGYELKLAIKPIVTTFNNLKDNKINEKHTYGAIKKRFELDAFKCIDESQFYVSRKGHRTTTYTRHDLITSYEHLSYQEINPETGVIYNVGFIPQWLKDPQMRAYTHAEVVVPPMICDEDTYNLWTGLKVEHINNVRITDQLQSDLQFMKDHIKLLCGNNDDNFAFTMKWIAFLFQYPGQLNGIALLFRSKPGLGKNLFFSFLENMIGSKYCTSIDDPARDLFGTFNSKLEYKVLVLLDEMSGSIGFKYSDRLKSLITSNTSNISRKGIDVKEIINATKFLFFTNNEFPVKIEAGDRRYCIFDSSGMKIPSHEYFARLLEIVNDESVQKLFYNELLTYNVEHVDWIGQTPITDYKKDIEAISRPQELNFMIEFLTEQVGVSAPIGKLTTQDLLDRFMAFAPDYKTNAVKFAIKIKNLLIPGVMTGARITNTKKGISFDWGLIREWMIENKYIHDDLNPLNGRCLL